MWRYTLCVMAILGMPAAGCGRKAPPPPSTAKPAQPPVRQVSAESAAEEINADLAVVAPKDGERNLLTGNSPDTPQATPDDNTDAEAAGRERIALLTPGGPLIVDVRVAIDGRPHLAPFDELVTKVLEAAGATKEGGQATWEALAGNQEFLSTQQPNQPAGSSQLKMWVERFDENRDGQIQRGEAMSWLGRDAGTTPSAFAVRSSRSYVSVPSASSRVWRLLDADRSGTLSAEEIALAAGRFWALDADDDRVISPGELATLREQLEAGGVPVAATPDVARYAAIHIEPTIDPDRLEYLLSDLYAPRQTLGPSSFPELAGLYKKIDANGDDWLEQLELADMVSMEPHLELAVAFGGPNASKVGEATLTVRDHVPEVGVVAAPSTNRAVLAVGSTRLIVSAHDLAASVDGSQTTEPSQIRVMVHDQCDAVFEELDQNADGRLGEREITAASTQLLARDANGDAQLAPGELRYSMIVAFLRGERQQEQSFYVPSFVRPTKDSPAPSWFAKADFNADGDISRREFVGSFERFAEVDENQDGYIGRDEAEGFEEKARKESD